MGRVAGERMTLTILDLEYAFRWIPPGSFRMGSSKKEQKEAAANALKFDHEGVDYLDEQNRHKVKISRGFWMQESPISQGMWKSVMGNNPSLSLGSERLPVERVSWNECQTFIEKLNGFGICPDCFEFSLPTEAEWEYACRARTTTPYWFGRSLNGDKANCDGLCPFGTDRQGPYLGKSTEPGAYPANRWGLYDMHGNVSEWVRDWFGIYPKAKVVDPSGPKRGFCRVFRGGSYGNLPVGCRAAWRGTGTPDSHDCTVGARLALRPVD